MNKHTSGDDERWCKGDDLEVCMHKQRYEVTYHNTEKVLQQSNWIDDEKILRSCVRARAEQNNITLHMARGRHVTQQNESRAFLWKHLNDPRVPWRHKRREMITIVKTIAIAMLGGTFGWQIGRSLKSSRFHDMSVSYVRNRRRVVERKAF